jgi:nicotinate phosphoribosyltransferase
VEAARGRRLVDFALRRTHGGDAAMRVARAAYLAGFDATSNVEAGLAYGIPVAGTMAHSYVQAHRDEAAAFTAFLDARPGPAVLLVDTYDTLAGVRTAIRVTENDPARLGGVRLDSGDMLSLSLATRAELDQAGRTSTAIFLSGGLDEHEIARLLDAGAPADAFGVGTRLGVVADSPALDMAYKLVAFDGAPSMKRSAGKATWPGPKQVWRVTGPAFHDVIGTATEDAPPRGVPLLQPAMLGGRTTWRHGLPEARARLAEARAHLPPTHRGLAATPIPRRWSPTLERLRDHTAQGLEAVSG